MRGDNNGFRRMTSRGSWAKRVSGVDSSCRRLIVPLFRGSSGLESLIVSHYLRFICECNKEETTNLDDDGM